MQARNTWWVALAVVARASIAGADNGPELSHLSDAINSAWFKAGDTWKVSGGAGGEFDKPAPCAAALDKLAAAHEPSTTTIDVYADNPDLPKGKHTLAEARKACDHIRRAGLIADWEDVAVAAASEHGKLSQGGGYDLRYFTNCVDDYAKMIKAGVAPGDRVQDQEISDGHGGKMQWSGTVEELRKKWCDDGVGKAKGLHAKEEAPYRKVLQADKLRLALGQLGGNWILAGGAVTSDPKQLAHANVWFVDLSRVDPGAPTCKGKDIHTVRRHQFDGAQKLVKTTTKDYCGSPPRSAFR
jgi:hypothetical protein